MEKKTIILKSADYVIKDYARIETDCSVVVQGDTIIDVTSANDLQDRYQPDKVVDLRGKLLLPGLVNCHTHVHETMMRGVGHDFEFHNWCDRLVFPVAKAMEAEGEPLYRDLTLLTALENIANGTTAFIEDSVNFAKRHSFTIAQAMQEMGIRGAVAKGAEDFSIIDQGHVGTLDQELEETQAFLEAWNAYKPDDLVQAWVGPSGGKRTVGGCTNEGLQKLKDLADSFDTRYHLHWAGTQPEIENVKRDTGLAGSVAMAQELGILDEKTSLAHCIWTVAEERDMLVQTNAQIVHCPSCNQICAIGVLPLVDLLERGVTVAIGTDGGPQNDSFDMFRDMRQAVLLQRITRMQADAISHLQAFQMATESGAAVLGLSNLGKIEPGYLADLVAIQVEGNPYLTPMYEPLETLVYAGAGARDVVMTMVNGEILYQDGEFKTIDARKVVSNVAQAAKRLKPHIKF